MRYFRPPSLLSIAALVFFGFLALFSRAALANMDQSMTAQFNAMINVTPGGTYETQAAKVITGGGFVYRPRVAQLRLLSIDPPRLRADCNGIDAYTGSLSFISQEAFINFLRNLSAAAPAYAFNMALSYLCKDCDQHLARLQKLAQDINSLTVNSCKIDSGEIMKRVRAVGSSIDEVAKSGKELSSHWAAIYNDPFGARRQGSNATGLVEQAAALGNPEAQAAVARTNVNVGIAAAQKSELSEWWGTILNAAEKKTFNEILISFTGTITTITTPTAEDASQKKDKTYLLPPLLKFTDFIYGGPREIYLCPTNECLITPDSPKQTVTLPSFRDKVTYLMIGDAGYQGIIYRLNARSAYGGAALDPQQRAFVTSLPGGVYAHLRELATHPSAALTYAKTLSEWIAAEITYEYLSSVLQAARITAAKSGAEDQKQAWVEALDVIDQQIISDRAKFSDTLRSLQANLSIATEMRANLARAAAVGIRPGQYGPTN